MAPEGLLVATGPSYTCRTPRADARRGRPEWGAPVPTRRLRPRTDRTETPLAAADQLWLSHAASTPGGPVGARRERPAPGVEPPRGALRVGTTIAVYAAGVVLFVGIVAVRGGPSVGDAYGVTQPTSAIADGHFATAARRSVLPQPPGYALLASPFVLAFRPLIGSPTWCDARVPPVTRTLLPWCAPDQLASHRWYRSQAVLGLLAWLALALGCVRLLRAAGVGGGRVGLLLVMVLAAVPAASDGIVQTFHPQDLVCVGLSCAGLAETLRRRWVVAGLLFGAAFLCKQFALLPLIAVLAAAPGWRARARVLGPALAVVGCGILPFAIADPAGTWNTLSAVNAGGVGTLTTGTVLGLTSLPESTKLLVARDGPVALALVMATWARWRARDQLLDPIALIGLSASCLAARLVAEVWFASYYLLAVSATLVLLDLAARRPPILSFTWIALTGVLVEQSGGIPTTAPAAAMALAAALAAVAIGLRAVPGRPTPPPVPAVPGRAATGTPQR